MLVWLKLQNVLFGKFTGVIKIYYICGCVIDKGRFLTGKARKRDYSSAIVAMESDFDSSKNEPKNGPWSTIISYYQKSRYRCIMLLVDSYI